MRIEPEISTTSIVLLGTFIPTIFTPAWFEMHELLPEGTGKAADLELAHPQVIQFSAEWLRLSVTEDRFRARTAQAPHIRVRDLVVRTFSEHLSQTPLRALGINRTVHFDVGSAAERQRIGRTLAPVEPWGEWGDELGLDRPQGGMTSLTMSRHEPEGRSPGGAINVKIEPSPRIGDGLTGVMVDINDHYYGGTDSPVGAEDVMQMLSTNFDESVARSDRIIGHIMGLSRQEA